MKNTPPIDQLRERLRSLPSLEPPANGWARMQRRPQALARRRRWKMASLATAATFLLPISLYFLGPPPPMPGKARPPDADIVALMARSRALETRLAELRPRVPMWDDRSARQVARFERDLSIVDLQLGDGGSREDQRLWQDRVDLLSSLVRMHGGTGYQQASYSIRMESGL